MTIFHGKTGRRYSQKNWTTIFHGKNLQRYSTEKPECGIPLKNRTMIFHKGHLGADNNSGREKGRQLSRDYM
ncbi:hypothetical protein DPMN_172141 [Dreissena polymorpha]|uniref:Uncharacterized protein n=1 Tax=Dreissena polymorpha TaxID=45954 RepID=A0A9D4DZA2_DREPO|nr:hypothetical protein DPMN_172141 [Dreissena polymorpha]